MRRQLNAVDIGDSDGNAKAMLSGDYTKPMLHAFVK
jgi:hypothetical protein